MALFGSGGHGFSLKALLEDPNLQNPPQLNSGLVNTKKGQHHGNYVSNSSAAFLGGNLWERPPAGGQGGNSPGDFDLEYMDLDEFLSENGIPLNTDETDDTQTISLLANALTASPPQSPNARALSINPPSPDAGLSRHSQGQLSPLLRTPVKPEAAGSINARNLGVFLPESPIRQSVSPLSFTSSASPNPASPSAIERCLMDDSFGVKVNVNKAPVEKRRAEWDSAANELLPDVDFEVKETDMAMVTIPVLGQDDSDDDDDDLDDILYSPDRWQSQTQNSPNHCHEQDPDHLIQNNIPGQQNFDPKRRKFTEEELKPQPIIKKSKKVFVEEGSKDDRYWARRKKNNVAAKRSRDARRVKENQIAMRASFLEQENENMKREVAKVRRENEELLKRLAKYESM